MSDQLPFQPGTGSTEAIAPDVHSAPLSETLLAESATQVQDALREKEQLQQLCDSMPQFVWMSNA